MLLLFPEQLANSTEIDSKIVVDPQVLDSPINYFRIVLEQYFMIMIRGLKKSIVFDLSLLHSKIMSKTNKSPLLIHQLFLALSTYVLNILYLY